MIEAFDAIVIRPPKTIFRLPRRWIMIGFVEALAVRVPASLGDSHDIRRTKTVGRKDWLLFSISQYWSVSARIFIPDSLQSMLGLDELTG